MSSARSVPGGEDRTHAPFVFEGFVRDAAGQPAAGAVVVSSAGGEAVVDESGFYHLEIELPLEAERVQLTAVGCGGRSLLASTSASVSASSGFAWVGTLSLTHGGSCPKAWLPEFGAVPGVDGSLYALVVFDDGSGSALYAGGSFQAAGGVATSGVAKWNGTSWSPLGSGTGGVHCLTVYDNGNGPALYAGGEFTTAGGVAANRIAKWDGTSWSALGSGLVGATVLYDAVWALTVYDDGSGPALYAGGRFTTAGGGAASNVAKWDGASWSALGLGIGSINDGVGDLAVYDDGAGPALFAGGFFASAGGVAASRIARWDGTSWSALGSGTNDSVQCLTVYDDGSGPSLYAGGYFTSAGGVAANKIARWNGTSWSALGSGTNDAVQALTVHDDGGGPALYAGGDFTTAGGLAASKIARWNGTSWSAPGTASSTINGSVRALAVYDVGGGAALHAGGTFVQVGSLLANRLAKWDGTSWSGLGSGEITGLGALTVYDDGGGPALHAAGAISGAVGIAKWNGSSWSALGSGTNGSVNCLTVYDDGSGPALFAGGYFTTAGGVVVNKIAKWDGSTWSALGSGLGWISDSVSTLTVYDDGSGPALFAGGSFANVGGVAVSNVARWDGTSWSALWSLFGYGTNDRVWALAVHDDGGGPALYAGGDFTSAGGVAASRIAKWDGGSWSALGSGTSHRVLALSEHDDGSGPALYAGGEFLTAGGVAASRIAKWEGGSWSALGSGMNSSVLDLTVHDDGDGPALYAGGYFSTAGGLAANRIAKWDGTSWSALGSGMQPPGAVLALQTFADGGGPALYAGGEFTSVPDSLDSFLARWGIDDTTAPSLTCPPYLLVGDRVNTLPGEVVRFSVQASDACGVPVVVCTPPSGSFFPRGKTFVTCTATDAAGNVSTCSFPVTVAPGVH